MAAMARFALAAALVLAVAGCGGGSDSGSSGGLSGTIEADGSSTVAPFVTAAAERFQRESPDVRITVGVSGTGGGFERFCRGETDISNASRPIESEEAQACKSKGIGDVEFQIANDALTVVVNEENTWVGCLTMQQLRKIWDRGSKVKSWKQVDPKFPDLELKLYGPGTDSGTFDFFTEKVNGEDGRSRSDYSASEDDNVIVQGVAGDKGALGYFGFSYYEQNQDKLKAVAIDAGSGCVQPSVETAQSGEYPLSRPLFIYVKTASLQRPEVEAFIRFVLDNETELAQAAQFVPMTGEQLKEAEQAFEAATT
jgi:phosphate transport system substrate-binding protein